jgi:hypothetical protein
MSLAIYAAPFDNSNIEQMSNKSDFINQKRQQLHNKTQKNSIKESFNTNKVNSVLDKIHNRDSDDDDEDNNYFSPPDKPFSAGVNKTISRENMTNQSTMNSLSDGSFALNNGTKTLGNTPKPNYYGDNLDLNKFSTPEIDSKQSEEYYKKILPAYLQQNVNKNTHYNNNTSISNDNDILLQKINYMIHLLEENKDEKTNNITEEVVLYSFLGIFVIFVVDSFTRVGKYLR